MGTRTETGGGQTPQRHAMGDPYLSGKSNTFDEMKSISKFLKSTCQAKMKMKLGRQNSSKVFEMRFSNGRRTDAKGRLGPMGQLGSALWMWALTSKGCRVTPLNLVP